MMIQATTNKAAFYRSRAQAEASLDYEDERTYRASGQCICGSCGLEYWRHPLAREPRHLSYDGEPFLHRLCSGDLVKL